MRSPTALGGCGWLGPDRGCRVGVLAGRLDFGRPAHPTTATGAAVSVLATTAALVQPWVGHAPHAAGSTEQARLGQTMGTAELGRELGDAGGPLLVEGVATSATPSHGCAVLSIVLADGPVIGLAVRKRPCRPN